ncbi:hypothetical protein Tco_0500557 [Tanacetum coccineum]
MVLCSDGGENVWCRAQLYVGKVTDGYKSNGGQMNKFATNVGVTSDSVSGPASSQMLQAVKIVWLLCCWNLIGGSGNICSAADGLNKVAHPLLLIFNATKYGVLKIAGSLSKYAKFIKVKTLKRLPVKKRETKGECVKDELFCPNFTSKESRESIKCSSIEHNEETRPMAVTKGLSLD